MWAIHVFSGCSPVHLFFEKPRLAYVTLCYIIFLCPQVPSAAPHYPLLSWNVHSLIATHLGSILQEHSHIYANQMKYVDQMKRCCPCRIQYHKLVDRLRGQRVNEVLLVTQKSRRIWYFLYPSNIVPFATYVLCAWRCMVLLMILGRIRFHSSCTSSSFIRSLVTSLLPLLPDPNITFIVRSLFME